MSSSSRSFSSYDSNSSSSSEQEEPKPNLANDKTLDYFQRAARVANGCVYCECVQWLIIYG